MEGILHFTLILSALYILGISPRKGVFVSSFALLPDLDVLLGIHRWFLHSIVILVAVGVPLVYIIRKLESSEIKKMAPLALIATISNPVIDVFYGYTPLLWPLSGESVWLKPGVNLEIGRSFSIDPYLHILTRSTEFSHFTHLEAPLVTGPGLIISIVLLIPLAVRVLLEKN